MSNNQITDSGVKTLTEAIIVNEAIQLQRLDLSYNKISDDGTVLFRNCLNANKTIKTLNLCGNRITDEGVKNLAEAIQENTTLENLDVSSNRISKEGVMDMLEACTKNRVLYKLVCRGNNLSEHGFVDIIKYIQDENAVQIFDASWNSIFSAANMLCIRTTYETFQISDNYQCRSRLDGINSTQRLYYNQNVEDLRNILICCFEGKKSVNIQGINNISMAKGVGTNLKVEGLKP